MGVVARRVRRTWLPGTLSRQKDAALSLRGGSISDIEAVNSGALLGAAFCFGYVSLT
jgi:hypothetical protein